MGNTAARERASARDFWQWWADQNRAESLPVSGHDPRIDYHSRLVQVEARFGSKAAAALRGFAVESGLLDEPHASPPTSGTFSEAIADDDGESVADDPAPVTGEVRVVGILERWHAPETTVPTPPARERWRVNQSWTAPETARELPRPTLDDLPSFTTETAVDEPMHLEHATPADPLSSPQPLTPPDSRPTLGTERPGDAGPNERAPTAADASDLAGHQPSSLDGALFDVPLRHTASAIEPGPQPIESITGADTTAAPSDGPAPLVESDPTDALMAQAQESLEAQRKKVDNSRREVLGNLLVSLGILILVLVFVAWVLF